MNISNKFLVFLSEWKKLQETENMIRLKKTQEAHWEQT